MKILLVFKKRLIDKMDSKDWKIYTKTGDRGETSLIGGTRVPKFHPRIEAYGTLDELNSYIGLIRDLTENATISQELLAIEACLFTAESQLATDTDANVSYQLPKISENDVIALELSIDKMNESLAPLTNFILPGGHPISSHCHIARCICRRAERIIIFLNENTVVDPLVIKYVNRLSDYLFVLARFVLYQKNVPEIKWESNAQK